MNEADLLRELGDRHAEYLVYDGNFRLGYGPEANSEQSLARLFKGWRQKIYRFDNDYGASVIFYQRVFSGKMAWDLMMARFFSRDPFTFRYADAPMSDLRWTQIQALLDDIKRKDA
ncbi:hypothetical protein BH24DEI1_BH24DEI1_19550 [soil metagenome]|nr:hypothetical protein [Deinococcota bacterium]